MAATAKEAHALVTYFEKSYQAKYAVKPVVNRYAARWGFDSILMSMNSDEAKALIDYYFTTPSANSHALDWFFYNYEKLINSKRVMDKDRAQLDRIREETRIRTEKWRETHGNH